MLLTHVTHQLIIHVLIASGFAFAMTAAVFQPHCVIASLRSSEAIQNNYELLSYFVIKITSVGARLCLAPSILTGLTSRDSCNKVDLVATKGNSYSVAAVSFPRLSHLHLRLRLGGGYSQARPPALETVHLVMSA